MKLIIALSDDTKLVSPSYTIYIDDMEQEDIEERVLEIIEEICKEGDYAADDFS